jgi:hypothetical protein
MTRKSKKVRAKTAQPIKHNQINMRNQHPRFMPGGFIFIDGLCHEAIKKDELTSTNFGSGSSMPPSSNP